MYQLICRQNLFIMQMSIIYQLKTRNTKHSRECVNHLKQLKMEVIYISHNIPSANFKLRLLNQINNI